MSLYHNQYKPKINGLQDKKILVTGATSGIGRIAALSFAQYGATIILLGRNNDKLHAIYDEILDANYPEPIIHTMDFEKAAFEDYELLANAIENEFGELHGLLNNAAILGELTPIDHYSPALWQKVMHVNVHAQFMMTKAMCELLKKTDNSSIIFTSSSVGKKGRAYWGAYGVSKFAIEGMMQTLSDENESISSIRVNSINPGAIRTKMRVSAFPAEDPMLLKKPEDIMSLYIYLMSDDSIGITGKSFDAQKK